MDQVLDMGESEIGGAGFWPGYLFPELGRLGEERIL